MTCRYCGTRNGDGEHRCVRCGRKPEDTLTGEFASPFMHGALATQLQPRVRVMEQAAPQTESRVAPNLSGAVQASLFHDRSFRSSNVIPFASYAPARVEVKPPRARAEAATKPTTLKPAVRRAKPAPEGQGTLDFLPPAPPKPRQLGTTVEAVIYCEAPVATTLHRAVAAGLDWAMVLIGCGLFVTALNMMGVEFALTKGNLVVFGAMFLMIGFTYGLIFSLAGAETPGMHWTQLRLTTFDGFPPEQKQRLVRFFAASLTRCTMLGLLWSLADEESLAWQDHISRTFPTPTAADTLVFRRR
jgi:uncharacterized RDD family membrane protein YckC